MNKKILIVDDEPGIVRLLALRLQTKGYETIEAYDGIQCCIVAEEELPDLILLDIKMPILNGIGAFEELLKLEVTKDIPVLFMTAYPTSQIKDQVLKMGAKGCISKPFISEDFEQTVDQALNKYDLNNNLVAEPVFTQFN